MKALRVAAAFLTILPGPRAVTEEDMVASVPWYPIVGLGLGALSAGTAMVLSSHVPALVGGLLVVALLAILTRGLHWDGVADVADAWGSGAGGERFWAILKDSRIGTFGVLAVVLGVGLQGAAIGEMLDTRRFAPLFLAPCIGRVACLVLALLGRDLSRPGLGVLCLRGATRRAVATNLIFALVLMLFYLPFFRAMLVISGIAAGLLWLLSLARRQGGINGDFLGAAIVLAETITLIAG